MSGLVGLCMLQAGDITCGNVGDGKRSWGSGGSSNVPVQSIQSIAALTASDSLALFTGWRTGAPPPSSGMDRFFTFLGQLASSDVPPTIIEMHRGVQIVRSADPPASSNGPRDRGRIRSQIQRTPPQKNPTKRLKFSPPDPPSNPPNPIPVADAPADDPMDIWCIEDDQKEDEERNRKAMLQREDERAQRELLLQELQDDSEPAFCWLCDSVVKDLHLAASCTNCGTVMHHDCASKAVGGLCDCDPCSSSSSS